jgi:hypothetical protein
MQGSVLVLYIVLGEARVFHTKEEVVESKLFSWTWAKLGGGRSFLLSVAARLFARSQPQPRQYISGFLGPYFFIIEKIEKIYEVESFCCTL